MTDQVEETVADVLNDDSVKFTSIEGLWLKNILSRTVKATLASLKILAGNMDHMLRDSEILHKVINDLDEEKSELEERVRRLEDAMLECVFKMDAAAPRPVANGNSRL